MPSFLSRAGIVISMAIIIDTELFQINHCSGDHPSMATVHTQILNEIALQRSTAVQAFGFTMLGIAWHLAHLPISES